MSITTPLLQKGYPTKQRSRGQSFAKVYVYEISAAYINSYLPDDNAQDPQGEEGYVFSSVDIAPGNTPSTRLLTVTYAPPNGGNFSSRKAIGSISKDGESSLIEEPIENHPDYEDIKTTAAAKGKKTYLKFPMSYIRTEVKSASATSFSQSLLVSNLGKKMAPPGLAGASSSQWALWGRSVSSDGDLLTIRETYVYDANSFVGQYGVS